MKSESEQKLDMQQRIQQELQLVSLECIGSCRFYAFCCGFAGSDMLIQCMPTTIRSLSNQTFLEHLGTLNFGFSSRHITDGALMELRTLGLLPRSPEQLLLHALESV